MSLVEHLKDLILPSSISGTSHSSVKDMILEAVVLIFFHISFCFFSLSWLDFSLRFRNVLGEFHTFFSSCFFFRFLDWWFSILRLLSLLFGPIHIVELIECLDILCKLLYSLLLLPCLLPFLSTDIRP
jgi:hypothetical protein